MRLLRLDLTRYGHLADVALDFPRTARLHVVLGPNEAGKSTALAAIGDALFGFPHRTDFAFQFETAQLRLGFDVEAADGTRAGFTRLKRIKNPLLDKAEQPVSEAELGLLLGGAARSLFETTYGLNGETLRKGALALLASGGEAGESLLAGMGLQNLRAALTRLDEQARALHGSRKHNQALSVALEGWKRARAVAEDAAVKPREWTEAQAELDGIRIALRESRAEAAALREEESRLRRARLIRPLLPQLDAQRRDLAAVADAPDLPVDAAARLDRLRGALRQAEEDARREGAEAERLEAELAGLAHDPAVLDLQDEIDALAAQRGNVADALRDLPAVERKVAEYRAQVAEAAAQLGTGAEAEAIRDRVPRPQARQKAQRLIIRRAELAAAATAAAGALREVEQRRDLAAARLGEAPVPPSSAPLGRAIAAARAEGKLDTDLATAERRLAEAAKLTAAALSALPLFAGDAASLAALELPLEPDTEAQAQRLAEAERVLGEAQAALSAIETEAVRLDGELAQLASGGTVPTPEVIAAARTDRDRAWRLLRRQVEGGAEPAPEARAGLPEGNLADAFEALRDTADRLADARADDAGRVATYAEKTARLRWLRERRGVAEAALHHAVADRAAGEEAWTALWSACGIAPRGPAAMQAWRRQRDEVLRRAALEAEAARQRDDLAARHAAARAALCVLLPHAAAPTLSGLLDAAEEACAATEAAETAHGALRERLEQEMARVEEARATRDRAAADLAALTQEWGAAMAALGLDAEVSAEAAEAALDAWSRIAEAATAWRGDAQRVADMQAATEGFAAATRDVLARLGEGSGEVPAPLAAAGLARRLAAARDVAKTAAALARQIRERRAAAEGATRRRDEAERELAALRATAGAADLAALEEAIRRTARRAELIVQGTTLTEELLRQGDGLEEALLRAEAAAVDPDAARARLEEIEAGEAARVERLMDLGRRQQAVESRLAAMEKGRDAAAHAQEARQHLAAAQEAAERFARLHVARTLLQAGIEKLRQQRQGPLLGAASAHFALLTGGRYTRLETDETETGQVLLRALRADRSSCPVDSLSEGTRDQLYLALRVAAVQAHAEGAEPLPFIADDLLATFDDTRAQAALALLAELGERVQTILFTHHAHIADLAGRQDGVHVQALTTA